MLMGYSILLLSCSTGGGTSGGTAGTDVDTDDSHNVRIVYRDQNGNVGIVPASVRNNHKGNVNDASLTGPKCRGQWVRTGLLDVSNYSVALGRYHRSVSTT
jgi:hypothetical protein